MVGGGSQNKLWRRIVADSFQLPLRFPAEPEAAALGAALQVGCWLAGGLLLWTGRGCHGGLIAACRLMPRMRSNMPCR